MYFSRKHHFIELRMSKRMRMRIIIHTFTAFPFNKSISNKTFYLVWSWKKISNFHIDLSTSCYRITQPLLVNSDKRQTIASDVAEHSRSFSTSPPPMSRIASFTRSDESQVPLKEINYSPTSHHFLYNYRELRSLPACHNKRRAEFVFYCWW